MGILDTNISELESDAKGSLEHLDEIVAKGAENVRFILAVFERGQSFSMGQYLNISHQMYIDFEIRPEVKVPQHHYTIKFTFSNGDTYEHIYDKLMLNTKHLAKVKQLKYTDITSLELHYNFER